MAQRKRAIALEVAVGSGTHRGRGLDRLPPAGRVTGLSGSNT
jgi:hypothetical protein